MGNGFRIGRAQFGNTCGFLQAAHKINFFVVIGDHCTLGVGASIYQRYGFYGLLQKLSESATDAVAYTAVLKLHEVVAVQVFCVTLIDTFSIIYTHSHQVLRSHLAVHINKISMSLRAHAQDSLQNEKCATHYRPVET